jgi:hypothetical protein
VFYDHIILAGSYRMLSVVAEQTCDGTNMTAIEFGHKLRKSLSNLVSAYDSYTAGLLIAGAIMIAVELFTGA